MSITNIIKEFSQSYKTEVSQKHSKNLKSYELLVNKFRVELSNTLDINHNLTMKGSIGAGVNTYYPWFGIFDSRVSTGAQNGFYVVLLFSDDFNDLYLTLNQGSTVQSNELIERNRKFIYRIYNNIDGFTKGKIPRGGLVKTKSGTTSKNGKKYEDTNIFYKKYDIQNLHEKEFISDINKIIKVYIHCVDKYINDDNIEGERYFLKRKNLDIEYLDFYKVSKDIGLFFSYKLIERFISSLLTKPFVILTGLSGSGKTKLAQAFAMWICESKSQYCIIPVGADWTNREPLLGFPNALKPNNYVKPDNELLNVLVDANAEPEKPYFLILDEMNLSHVERYFADFLSVMESKDKISLHPGDEEWNGVPPKIGFPENLFIIGTVNVDETTYMFSPKVLDRANVIEFSVTADEMKNFLLSNTHLNLDNIEGAGASIAEGFVRTAGNKNLTFSDAESLNDELLRFFNELKKTGAEFGYRSASEILRFAAIVKIIAPDWDLCQITDAAIMQKLLPKVHGSRRKLEPVLKTLGTLCLLGEQTFDELTDPKKEIDYTDTEKIKYPVSLEKIVRMYKNLLSNGFTSYAEA